MQQENKTMRILIAGFGGQGVLTEVYVDTDEETIDVVIINTYIADVSADYNDKKEYLSVGVKNYGANAPTKVYLDDVAGIEKYKKTMSSWFRSPTA